MIEIGREANQDFERRFLGPRADLETELEIGDSPEESAQKWAENCRRMCEVPTLTPNFDLTKAQEQQERERAEAMKQWRARLDWQASKGQTAAEGGKVDDSSEPDAWVDRRVVEGYTVPRKGGFIERSANIVAARILAKMQTGITRESAIAAEREDASDIIVDAAAEMVDA